MTVNLLISLCIILLILLGAASYFAIRFALIILRMEDAIENCIDVLDERYDSISQIMDIPLFSDSPEIKRVHADIGRSRDAILQIANVLTRETLQVETEDSAPEEKEGNT